MPIHLHDPLSPPNNNSGPTLILRLFLLGRVQVNPGQWFAATFGPMIQAEKVLVQKSGYFARSAAANSADRKLIEDCVDVGIACGLRGESGCIGQDEERGDQLRAIEFERIAGGKAFNKGQEWFTAMLKEIGQAV